MKKMKLFALVLALALLLSAFEGCSLIDLFGDETVSPAEVVVSPTEPEPEPEPELPNPYISTWCVNDAGVSVSGIAADGSTVYTTPIEGIQQIWLAESFLDGSVAVVGVTEMQPRYDDNGEYFDEMPYKGELIYIDSTGNVRWTYPLTGNIDQVSKMVLAPNGDIYTVGSFYIQKKVKDQSSVEGWQLKGNIFGKRIMRFSANGRLLAELTVEKVEGLKEGRWQNDAVFTANNQLAVLFRNDWNPWKPWLSKSYLIAYDEELNEQWRTEVPFPSDDISCAMSVSEGRIMVISDDDVDEKQYAYFSPDGENLGIYTISGGEYIGSYQIDGRTYTTNGCYLGYQDAVYYIMDEKVWIERDGVAREIDSLPDNFDYQDCYLMFWQSLIGVQLAIINFDTGYHSYKIYEADGNIIADSPIELLPNGAPCPNSYW